MALRGCWIAALRTSRNPAHAANSRTFDYGNPAIPSPAPSSAKLTGMH
jgi:hypothetical protein